MAAGRHGRGRRRGLNIKLIQINIISYVSYVSYVSYIILIYITIDFILV
jgi:hypothetical protein